MIPKPHALLTIIAPLALDRLGEAEAEIDRNGNPARELAAELDKLDGDGLGGTHFMSLHAFASTDGVSAFILLELSADGSTDEALGRLVRSEVVALALRRIFVMTKNWTDGGNLLAFLKSHLVTVGSGFRDNPGLCFAGTPGLSVGRIRLESKLAQTVTRLLGEQRGDVPALTRLARVRAEIGGDPVLARALEPADTEIQYNAAPGKFAPIGAIVAAVAPYFQPVLLLVIAWALGTGIAWAIGAPHGFSPNAEAFFAGIAHGLWNAIKVAVVAVVIVLAVAYALFRSQEARDSTDERAADHRVNAEMFARENKIAQNHMISITRRKPGLIRALAIRVVFAVIASNASRIFRPGFLGKIGTIHFARWVTPPGSRDLIFASNYDGSWESYLEDFITLLHGGLTAVWSNSVGFPRTENLVQKGASDGERFKRYARRSMIPTRMWYSAYPQLSVALIRRNAAIRRGFSGAMTEDEAKDWLALFGSAVRPASKLMSSEIQSLIFGGMGFMPHGTCLLFERLPESRAAAKEGLRALMPLVAFNDGRLFDRGPDWPTDAGGRSQAAAGSDEESLIYRQAVVTLALGPDAFRRLGLPEEALQSFPFAFLEGMTGGARARILGDTGDNAPEYWRWGRTAPDLAMLVYGKTPEAVDDLVATVIERAGAVGMAAPHAIRLRTITEDKREPFGFMDGASQPVIRGTYKGRRNPDPIHLVEPGEFVLGYPDNRDNLPPGPVLRATDDPDNHLPLVGRESGFDTNRADDLRDLGCNGSFLVIRQLEQDVSAFSAYCRAEAERLEYRLPAPYEITEEFIAAKLVGRWKDGSSLVRHPYESRTSEIERRGGSQDTVRARTAPDEGKPPIEAPATQAPASAPASYMETGAIAPAGAKPPRSYADNDFLFGTEDPEALRCPFGAHIRRANPRDSLDPGSKDQIDISNRHRIIRVGRQVQAPEGGSGGLLFMCLNSDIERQFEFLQQTWLRSPSFHALSCEKDPILGDAEEGMCGFTIPSRNGPVSLKPMPRFVTTRGGGYFFLPGKRLLEFLGRAP
ncbi:MAG: hypothetical protein ABIT04_09415 [Novosphingobium sp.]